MTEEIRASPAQRPPGRGEPAADGVSPAGLSDRDPDYIRRSLPGFNRFLRPYFRPEVRGLENIPDGPSLLVGNHSGGFYIVDSFLFAAAFYDHFGPERAFHQLARGFALRIPVGGAIIRRYGAINASHDTARAAFRAGAPVLVYPGGEWEAFRPSWHSSRIEFGRRRGYVRLALSADVPIVPVVAIGGQETALFLTRGARLARMLRLDRRRLHVVPVAIGPPFVITVFDMPLRIPLPAKITIEVLPPIHLRDRFGPDPDPDTVNREVTGEMQRALDRLAGERRFPVIG